ncbi:MAG: DUF2802 domain-containing protein [Sulfuricella sp.]
MESLVITWRELLIVVAVVLAVYIAEMLLLLRSKRGGRRWKADAAPAEPRLDALEGEIEQLREQLLHFKDQLDKLEAAPPPQANAQSSPYSQAIQLAKQGADVSEVAANCGISRGEAELIVAMHRAKGL